MTRPETLAAIKDRQRDQRRFECGRAHAPGCEEVPGCPYCTIGWLLQEIEYLIARSVVAEQFKTLGLLGKSSYQEVVEQGLRVQLAEAQVEIERLRAEMARVDAHHVAQYLASRQ